MFTLFSVKQKNTYVWWHQPVEVFSGSIIIFLMIVSTFGAFLTRDHKHIYYFEGGYEYVAAPQTVLDLASVDSRKYFVIKVQSIPYYLHNPTLNCLKSVVEKYKAMGAADYEIEDIVIANDIKKNGCNLGVVVLKEWYEFHPRGFVWFLLPLTFYFSLDIVYSRALRKADTRKKHVDLLDW